MREYCKPCRGCTEYRPIGTEYVATIGVIRKSRRAFCNETKGMLDMRTNDRPTWCPVVKRLAARKE